MGIELTKSAKRSIAKLYKSYLDRLRSGENKAQAVFFNNEKSDQAELIRSIQEDVPELKKVGFVKMDITGCLTIQGEAVVYMENIAGNTLKEWLSFGAQFIP